MKVPKDKSPRKKLPKLRKSPKKLAKVHMFKFKEEEKTSLIISTFFNQAKHPYKQYKQV